MPSESQTRLIFEPAISVQSIGVSEIGIGSDLERWKARVQVSRSSDEDERCIGRTSEAGVNWTVQAEASTSSSTSNDQRSRCMSAKSKLAASRVKSWDRGGRRSQMAGRRQSRGTRIDLEAALGVADCAHAERPHKQMKRVHKKVPDLRPLFIRRKWKR